jgi:hypothetical protein
MKPGKKAWISLQTAQWPISESILSDSRDLRRHFRVGATEFGAGRLSGSAWDRSEFPPHEPGSRGRFRHFALGHERRKKRRKRKPSFAKRNERFRDAGRKSLISLWGEIGYFAGLFVFNDLTAFSLRAVALSPGAWPRCAS